MPTYRIEFTPESGIEPQTQTVEAEGLNSRDEEYVFTDIDLHTVRVVRKEFVRQIVRE